MSFGNSQSSAVHKIAVWCAVLPLVLLSEAARGQSYRTQQSIRPQPLFSLRHGQSLPKRSRPIVVHTARFLGWKETSKQGLQSVKYFLNLEDRKSVV